MRQLTLVQIVLLICLVSTSLGQRGGGNRPGGGGGTGNTPGSTPNTEIVIPEEYDTPVPTGAVDDVNIDPCLELTSKTICKKCANGFVRMFANSGIYCGVLVIRKIKNVKEGTCTPSKFDLKNRVGEVLDPKNFAWQIFQDLTDDSAPEETICWSRYGFVTVHHTNCEATLFETFKYTKQYNYIPTKPLYTGAVGCFKCAAFYSYAKLEFNKFLGIYVRMCDFRRLHSKAEWTPIKENDYCDKLGYIYTKETIGETGDSVDLRLASPTTQAKPNQNTAIKSGPSTGDKEFTCAECLNIVPNCLYCSSRTTCEVCEAGYYPAELTPKPGFSTSEQPLKRCLHNSCGYSGKNIDSRDCSVSCSLKSCQSCQSLTVSDSGAKLAYPLESCLLCEPNMNLESFEIVETNSNRKTTIQKCVAEQGEVSFNFQVVSTESMTLSASQLELAKDSGKDMTEYGQYLSNPYRFISQAIHDLTSQRKGFHKYKKVTANLYLSKGVHPFFWCLPSKDKSKYYDSFNSNLLPKGNWTKLCSELPNLSMVYPVTDNLVLNVKPLLCGDPPFHLNRVENTALFYQYCIEDVKAQQPVISVQSSLAAFNITRNATFTDIAFTAEDSLAQYDGLDSVTEEEKLEAEVLMSSLPFRKCTFDQEPSPVGKKPVIRRVSYDLDFQCELDYDGTPGKGAQGIPMEDNYLNCTADASKVKGRQDCHGQPQQDSFWILKGDTAKNEAVFAFRHRTLFNLYSFDAMRSTYSSPPGLTLERCSFKYFAGNFESLINIQTTNYAPMGKLNFSAQQYATDAYLIQYGSDRAARIRIVQSEFKHSSFCKGMIVYRAPQLLDDMRVISFHAQAVKVSSEDEDEVDDGLIEIIRSKFSNLAYAQILTHLAHLDKTQTKESLTSKKIGFSTFFHQGMVLNTDGFKGKIQIDYNDFRENMINIPQIYITEYNVKQRRSQMTAQGKLSNVFLQDDLLAFKRCNPDTNQTQYFFDEGLDANQELKDLETIYEKYERASLFYISHNQGQIVFVDNQFHSNIGLFGGAINIDSPDWTHSQESYEPGNKPYVILSNNKFKRNMAYIAGNGVYIRLTADVSNPGEEQVCGGGILIQKNGFYNNIGLKKTNGGALSVVCSYIDPRSPQPLDHRKESGIKPFDLTRIEDRRRDHVEPNLYDQTVQVLDLNYAYFNSPRARKYNFYPFSCLVKDNTFQENMAGQAGSALYIYNINMVRIESNDFTYNGPVFAFLERQNSPYFNYIAHRRRTISYHLPNSNNRSKCWDEFKYFGHCIRAGMAIDMPNQQGALHIKQTISSKLIIYEEFKQLCRIENNTFYSNQVNYILSPDQKLEQASSLFISGGKQNVIINNKFLSHKSNMETHFISAGFALYKWMPIEYFKGQQGSIVKVVTPIEYEQGKGFVKFTTFSFKTSFTGNSFTYNFHYQVLTFKELTFGGSLVDFQSDVPTAELYFTRNTVRNNSFIGSSGSMISMEGGVLAASTNNFSYNGRASLKYTKSNRSSVAKWVKDLYFPYESYNLNPGQYAGVFYINMKDDMRRDQSHTITDNYFSHIFCQRGCAASVTGAFKTQVYFARNSYSYMLAAEAGSIFDASKLEYDLGRIGGGHLLTQFVRENVNFSFGTAISIYGSNKPITIIHNSRFNNCFGLNGGAVNLTEGGALFVRKTDFTMDPGFYGLFKRGATDQTKFHNWVILTIKTGFANSKPIFKFVSNEFLTAYAAVVMRQDQGQVSVNHSLGKDVDPSIQIYYQPSEIVFEGEDWTKPRPSFSAQRGSSSRRKLQGGLFNTFDNLKNAINGTYDSLPTQSQIIDSKFSNLVGGTASAIRIRGKSSLTIKGKQSQNVFSNNYATNGGAIYILDSQIQVSKARFDNNKGGESACFKLNSSELDLTESLFESNESSEGAGFKITQLSRLNVTNSTFRYNLGDNGSILKSIEAAGVKDLDPNSPAQKGIITFTNSQFVGNFSKRNLFYLFVSYMNISNCSFENNYAQAISSGFTLISSKLYATQIKVSQDLKQGQAILDTQINHRLSGKTQSIKLYYKSVETGFFKLEFDSLVDVKGDSVFQSLHARDQAILLAESASKAQFHPGSRFIGNSVTSITGSIFEFRNADLASFKGVTFLQNKGAAIKSTLSPTLLYNSVVSENNGSGIDGAEVQCLTVSNSTFSDQSQQSQTAFGLGVKCDNCGPGPVVIEKSVFQNLSAHSGTAIYLNEQQKFIWLKTNNDAPPYRPYMIRANQFINNRAFLTGGAIRLANVRRADLWQNTFKGNVAKPLKPIDKSGRQGEAGALLYSCRSLNCDVRLKSNIFEGNQASSKGGAILWTNTNFTSTEAITQEELIRYDKAKNLCRINTSGKDKQQVIAQIQAEAKTQFPPRVKVNPVSEVSSLSEAVTDSNAYSNNTAPYGPNIGSFPYKIVLKQDNVTLEDNGWSFNPIEKNLNIISGFRAKMQIQIIDRDNKLYSDESFALCSMRFMEGYNNKTQIISSDVIANKGTFNYVNMRVFIEPGQTAKLRAKVTDLELYGNPLNFDGRADAMMVTARKCISGEEYLEDLSCVRCKPGFYSYKPMTSPGRCKPCFEVTENQYCFGRNITAPRPGYWRETPDSEDYIRCPSQESCLGGSFNDALGSCEEGSTGILCTDCEQAYAKHTNSRCQKCPAAPVHFLLLLLQITSFSAMFYILVRTTFNNLTLRRPLTMVYFKIFLSHFQFMTMIFNIALPMPAALTYGTSFLNYFFSYHLTLFHVDCLIKQNQALHGVKETYRYFYYRLGTILLFYAAISLINFLYWFYKTAMKLDWDSCWKAYVQIQMIINFMAYPALVDIIAVSTAAFRTTPSKSTYRLWYDPEVIFFQDAYIFIFLFVTLTGFVSQLVGFLGVPTKTAKIRCDSTLRFH